jgi:hypothetical protein
MTEILKTISSFNHILFVAAGFGVLILWFLPAILALIFNRKYLKAIFLACFPAGFSFVAWGGLLLWAVLGKSKILDKHRDDSSV